MTETPKLSTVFSRNWTNEIGQGGVDVQEATANDRAALTQADANHDGTVSMEEARDVLIANEQVRADGLAKSVKAALEHVFKARTGRVTDLTGNAKHLPAHVVYIQLANRSGRVRQAETDLGELVKKDPDKPKLDKLNMSNEITTQGDAELAKDRFKKGMRDYLNTLVGPPAQRMTGFLVSAHSNGEIVLEQTPDHMYYGTLDIRQALRELRAENPEYARLMDSCEKVALMGCFMGGATDSWAQLFPNATIAGTQSFCPSSDTHYNAAIYDAAATAHQRIEDGLRNKALDAGFSVRYVGELKNRQLNIRTPNDPANLRRANRDLQLAEQAYNASKATIDAILAHGGQRLKPGTTDSWERMNQATLDDAYKVMRSYAMAYQRVLDARGAASEDETLSSMRFTFMADDLFAIRMKQERPQPPFGMDR